MRKKQLIKNGLKKTLNFTFEKVIPVMISIIADQVPKTLEKYEKHDRMTNEKLEELYDKTDRFYDTMDKISDASHYFNDKVNKSKFFDSESKR